MFGWPIVAVYAGFRLPWLVWPDRSVKVIFPVVLIAILAGAARTDGIEAYAHQQNAAQQELQATMDPARLVPQAEIGVGKAGKAGKEGDDAADHDEERLRSERDAVEAAKLSAKAAVWSDVINVLTLMAAAAAAIAAWSAARGGAETLAIAGQTFIAENRAWLSVAADFITTPFDWLEASSSETRFIIRFTLKNHGNAPVIDASIKAEVRELYYHSKQELRFSSRFEETLGDDIRYAVFPGEDLPVEKAVFYDIESARAGKTMTPPPGAPRTKGLFLFVEVSYTSPHVSGKRTTKSIVLMPEAWSDDAGRLVGSVNGSIAVASHAD